ncbi:MAG: VWA domain-containing protein, partial [Phycisphaerae bacterium]|nr:VWA domain-containing protein [Phycisphaerae bacterium]
ERSIEGEVKERNQARQIYESAKAAGYVASLLEQERPNIFTQSVANIEPGSTVTVEISYVETLAMKDGVYEFAFPMVVGPRYIPGQPSQTPPLPAGWTARTGVVLLGPASLSAPDSARLLTLLDSAIPVATPNDERLAVLGAPTQQLSATYADGSQEPVLLYANGCGAVGGRWFVVPSSNAPDGNGFAPDTNQVPDASRVTPMPVRPSTRAGHDISLSVSMDTGGPGLRDLVSQLHGVDLKWDGTNRCTLSLRGGSTIPNKDFVLNWGLEGKGVLEGAFSYVRPHALKSLAGADADAGAHAVANAGGDAAADVGVGASNTVDGFVTLVMTPPPPAPNSPGLARELVFVMDTSGSMNGFPIEKSKEVMRKALAAMRADDRFNVVTFAGSTAVLWPEVRPATPENVKIGLDFVNGARSGGGTEMMTAINAALVQMPTDGVTVAPDGSVSVPPGTPVSPAPGVDPQQAQIGADDQSPESQRRAANIRPMRVAVFLTDGFVGNDQGIIAAVAQNAGSTRVFTFGIGNSVNRYLLEEMARQGRGACDIVLLSEGADAAVDLFTRRMQTPVLRDISVTFEGLDVTDLQPSGRLLPDLFDIQPLVVHGR